MTHFDAITTSEVREAVRVRSGAMTFFVMVFSSTWLLQLPYILAQQSIIVGPAERFMPLVVLGFFAPTIIAVLLARFDRGAGGIRALFRPLGIWRVGTGWYVIALTMSAAIFLAGMAVYALVAHDVGRWWYPPSNAQTVAAMLIIPFTEQIAWRGFAYPRVVQRHGALVASLIVGVLWALFHAQKHLFLDQPTMGVTLASIVYMTAGTVVFTWIYNRTRRSLLLVVVAHAGVYLNNPTQALPADVTPLLVHTAAFCVAALVLVLADRKAFSPAP